MKFRNRQTQSEVRGDWWTTIIYSSTISTLQSSAKIIVMQVSPEISITWKIISRHARALGSNRHTIHESAQWSTFWLDVVTHTHRKVYVFGGCTENNNFFLFWIRKHPFPKKEKGGATKNVQFPVWWLLCQFPRNLNYVRFVFYSHVSWQMCHGDTDMPKPFLKWADEFQ